MNVCEIKVHATFGRIFVFDAQCHIECASALSTPNIVWWACSIQSSVALSAAVCYRVVKCSVCVLHNLYADCCAAVGVLAHCCAHVLTVSQARRVGVGCRLSVVSCSPAHLRVIIYNDHTGNRDYTVGNGGIVLLSCDGGDGNVTMMGVIIDIYIHMYI